MATLTDSQIAIEAEQIRNEEAWPNWPILPMKNLDRKMTDESRLGVMIGSGDYAEVWWHNSGHGMFALLPVSLDMQLNSRYGWTREQYDSTEQMVAVGWVGD